MLRRFISAAASDGQRRAGLVGCAHVAELADALDSGSSE